MATYTTDKIEFGGNIYKLQDSDALPLTGGSVTGPVNFGDSVTMEEASVGDLIITGNASSTNNFQMNTLNGVEVGDNPAFTDTVTTVTTSGSGNAITAISASNGAITATKGTTFLTSHQDISGKADKSATVSTVTWDSTNKKLTKTINGTTTDVVTAATLRTGLNVADGAEVNQNAFSNIKVGSTTIAADAKTDTVELVAGSNVTLTPDATNDKVTIAATDTTYTAATAAPGKVASASAQGSSTNYARQDHTHGIDLATGDANGQVKIAGTNVSVKGLGALAYEDTVNVTKEDIGLGNVENIKFSGIIPVIGTQTATTASWTGEIDLPALYDGLTIAYYLPRTSANNVTLNLTLNNNTITGAIPVYVTSTTRMTTHYGAGSTIILTYWSAGSILVNGTATTENRWTHGDYWNSNTIGEYGGVCYAGPKGMARYSLIMRIPPYGEKLDRWESFVLTSTTGTSKTKNTSGFMLDSPILYQSGGTYDEDENCASSASWITIPTVDTRYSFNVSSSWSQPGRPLFIVGTIENDLFYLANQWWSDHYPTTNDGLYYRYIGQMTNHYQFVLHSNQPYFYYNNGLKQLNIGTLYQSNHVVVSATQPIDQNTGDIWFVVSQ